MLNFWNGFEICNKNVCSISPYFGIILMLYSFLQQILFFKFHLPISDNKIAYVVTKSNVTFKYQMSIFYERDQHTYTSYYTY